MLSDHRWVTAGEYAEMRRYRAEFAFAVPTDEAIAAIAALGPIIEFGAGTGYWAHLLAEADANIVAIEHQFARKRPAYGQQVGRWHPVRTIGAMAGIALMLKERRTPLLVWPPYDKPLAYDVARAVPIGGRLVYVGEGAGGNAGCERFHALLSADFAEEQRHHLPRLPGMHDGMAIWRRMA